jgi:Tfp pilus assembly protein PilV
MHTQPARGATLIEVMATTLVLLLGLGAAMMMVTETARQNRRNLTATQAQLIAEQELETLVAQGCTPQPPCDNIRQYDRSPLNSYPLWQTASGELLREPPANAAVVARQFRVDIDVDGPDQYEGGERGAPRLDRTLVDGLRGPVYNVRLSVSWEEPGGLGQRQVVVLQTRMAP